MSIREKQSKGRNIGGIRRTLELARKIADFSACRKPLVFVQKGAEPPAVRKGQASTEFLAFLILIMIISVAVYAGAFGKLSDAASSEGRFGLQSACGSVAGAVNRAQTFGSGFSSNISLPQGSMEMLNGTAVCAGGNDVFMEAVIGNVRNSTGDANFNLGKQISIANSLGTVIIS